MTQTLQCSLVCVHSQSVYFLYSAGTVSPGIELNHTTSQQVCQGACACRALPGSWAPEAPPQETLVASIFHGTSGTCLLKPRLPSKTVNIKSLLILRCLKMGVLVFSKDIFQLVIQKVKMCKEGSYEGKEKGESIEQERKGEIVMEEKGGKKGKRFIKLLLLNIL